MNKVTRKLFWVWNQDKEIAYLEAQARAGLMLSSVSPFKYVFCQVEPVARIFRMDFQGLNRHFDEVEYLDLFRETGWELACKSNGWYYFSRVVAGDVEAAGATDIFNDNASRLMLYQRLMLFLMIVYFPLFSQIAFLLPRLLNGDKGFWFVFGWLGILVAVLPAYALVRLGLLYRALKRSVGD